MQKTIAPDTELHVSLSAEDARFVREKVASGEFSSRDEVLHRALDGMRSEDLERERWIKEELLPAIDEYERDPSSALTPEQVRRHLAERRSTRRRAS